VTYPGTISLSTAHLTHLADVLRAHRRAIGSRWRKLTPSEQALLVVAGPAPTGTPPEFPVPVRVRSKRIGEGRTS
jgi:hypothetical protein